LMKIPFRFCCFHGSLQNQYADSFSIIGHDWFLGKNKKMDSWS
jgi:hypothetical protein